MQGISVFQQRLAQNVLAVVWQSGPNVHGGRPFVGDGPITPWNIRHVEPSLCDEDDPIDLYASPSGNLDHGAASPSPHSRMMSGPIGSRCSKRSAPAAIKAETETCPSTWSRTSAIASRTESGWRISSRANLQRDSEGGCTLMRGDGALSDPPNSGSRYAPEDQVMSLTTSPEGTKDQEATARSLARREKMIERLAEPVAAHILEAAAEDQAVVGLLPVVDRSEDQPATVVGHRLATGKANAVGTLDLDLVGHDRIVHHSIERNFERLSRSGRRPAHVPLSLQ